MVEPEEHASADGLLTLAVESLKDGDVAIGFRGYPWHTHADILASLNSMNEPDAVRQFIDDVLNDRLLIAVQIIDDAVHDVWITDDPAKDCKYTQSNEEIQFRYWSGRGYSPNADSPNRNAIPIYRDRTSRSTRAGGSVGFEINVYAPAA